MNNPLIVALIRSLYTAFPVGLGVFLATWSQTNDVKTLIIATATAMLGIIGGRGGVEGVFDQRTKPDMNIPPAADLDNLPEKPK